MPPYLQSIRTLNASFSPLAVLPLLTFLLMAVMPLQAQDTDLYDQEHSEQFTNYLMKTGQYHYACEELERLLFLDPKSDSLKVQLLTNYRLGRNLGTGLSRAEDFLLSGLPSLEIRKEYVKLLALNQNFDKLHNFLSLEGIQTCEREQSVLQSVTLQQDWKLMQTYDLQSECLSTRDKAFYGEMLNKGLEQRHRSPMLALGMSAIVPGTGKVYAGEWKDGIMSFIFVASMAWQSYRGFNRKGTKSVYGWVFGGLATGMYAGNLYGSHKSARMFNDKQKEALAREIEAYVYGGY